MVTHPLDLNSRLRPPPRSFDWVFYVNIAVIVMFFLFFGSRFILSPAIAVNSGEFHPPIRPTNQISYVQGTVVISIKSNGQIFTDTGLVSHSQLKIWLAEKVKQAPDSSLLLRADAGVRIEELMLLDELARQAGFKNISIPVEPAKEGDADAFGLPLSPTPVESGTPH